MLDRLTLADFSGRIGESFRIDGSTPIELTLVEVTDLARRENPEPRRGAFSLVFRGPRVPALPQRIHPLTNEALGRLEIFLVPIGLVPTGPGSEGVEGTLYEAVFN